MLVNSQAVADYLMRQIPDIAFAEVDFRGTQASIRIYERALPPPSLGTAHIVASKAGLITEVLALKGRPHGEGR